MHHMCTFVLCLLDSFFFFHDSATTEIYTLSHTTLFRSLITNDRSSLMAVNIHITIIELNALHTKRQNLFQELDAVIHLLMERSEERFSRNAETDLVCRLLLEKKKDKTIYLIQQILDQ